MTAKLWAGLGLVAVVLAILAGINMAGRKAGAEAEAKRQAPVIAKLEREKAACLAQVDDLTFNLEKQNAAVDQLKIEADERTKRANAAIAAAQQEARTYKARAERIARAKPSGDLCVAARGLIVDTLAEDRQ